MKKLRIYVKETIRHAVTLDSNDFDLDEVKSELDGEHGDYYAGDFCSRSTMEDGEWELEDYEIIGEEQANGSND